MTERLAVEDQVSVLDKVAYRVKTGSQLGQREDPWSIALAVDSCGMGGVVSGAELLVLVAITNADSPNPDKVNMPFDKVFAVSSASCNVACWLSGKGRVGLETYFKELSRNGHSGRFIDRSRFLRTLHKGLGNNHPWIDLDFMLDVLNKKGALDFDRVAYFQEQGLELHIYSTEYLTGEAIDFFPIDSQLKGVTAVVSSCSVTNLARLVDYNGLLLTDGGDSKGNLLLDEAVDSGAGDILCLMIHPIKNSIEYELSIKTRLRDRLITKTFPKRLGRSYLQSRRKHLAELRTLEAAKAGLVQKPNIESIEITDHFLAPSMLEDDPERVYQGALTGQQAALRAFLSYGLPITEGVLLG